MNDEPGTVIGPSGGTISYGGIPKHGDLAYRIEKENRAALEFKCGCVWYPADGYYDVTDPHKNGCPVHEGGTWVPVRAVKP